MTVNQTDSTDAATPTSPPATQAEAPAAEAEERIRKVYVKDLKTGESIHTVFKCLKKERHTTRSGKPYLSVVLCDRTGEVDSRVFENVEAAETVFAIGDYLLVKAKTGTFHGKPQIVIERLERLDPEPIDAAEFAWTSPPKPAEPAAEERRPKEPARSAAREPEPEGDEVTHKAARQRLLRLLDSPQLALALDAVVRHLEAFIDERIAVKLGQPVPTRAERAEARKPKSPRVEHRPHVDSAAPPSRPELKRDPSLPSGLAFKPLDALVGPAPSQPRSENAAAKPSEG